MLNDEQIDRLLDRVHSSPNYATISDACQALMFVLMFVLMLLL